MNVNNPVQFNKGRSSVFSQGGSKPATPKQKAARHHNYLLYRLACARAILRIILFAPTVGQRSKRKIDEILGQMDELRQMLQSERIDP